MDIHSAWLIYHKATMEPDSPMNLDGSDFMSGVGVVPATSMKQALSHFDQYLSDNKMAIVDITKCERWNQDHFTDGSIEHNMILNAVKNALASNSIHYTFGESSESLMS